MNSAVSAKQDKLTFDTTPKSGSSNPITSGGVYTAINENSSLTVPSYYATVSLKQIIPAEFSIEASVSVSYISTVEQYISDNDLDYEGSVSCKYPNNLSGYISFNSNSFSKPSSSITLAYIPSTKSLFEYNPANTSITNLDICPQYSLSSKSISTGHVHNIRAYPTEKFPISDLVGQQIIDISSTGMVLKPGSFSIPLVLYSFKGKVLMQYSRHNISGGSLVISYDKTGTITDAYVSSGSYITCFGDYKFASGYDKLMSGTLLFRANGSTISSQIQVEFENSTYSKIL